MSISRRDLYAAGEPLGDSATRAKLGGGVVCGFGGSSSSSSSTSNKNEDNRITQQSGVAVSGSSGTTVNVTDGGIVSRALDSIDLNNATNAQGFEQLLTVAGDLFTQSQGLIGQTQKAVADAYTVAQADKAGTLDNKTIIILAVVAGVALVLAKGKL